MRVDRPARPEPARAVVFGLDRVELAALAALAALSMAVLAALLTKGRPITGADGLLASDQLQYFTWIRESSEHVLIGNRYDFQPDHRVFLHPGFLLSGLLHRATGISIPLSYLLWKPAAVVLAFAAARAYVGRLVEGRGARHAALLLILFGVMPASALVAWTGWGGKPRQYTFDFISGEMWTGQYLWGYLMTAIAVFLIPVALLAVERWRRTRRLRPLVVACLAALFCSWLQPWQGTTLVLVVLGAEAIAWWRSRERPAPAFLAVPAAAVLPLAYYFVLSSSDPSWKLASQTNQAGSHLLWTWPWWAIVLTLAPLAVPAALAYRRPARDWQEVALRLWPLAALAVYVQPAGTFPFHSFQGLAIPLSVLAVQGVTSVWPRPRAALVVALLTLMSIPGWVHKAEVAANSVHRAGDPYFVFPDEQHAIAALAHDPRAGGVLAPAYDGHMLPYQTGREVWVGALSWTPDWDARVRATRALFETGMAPGRARAYVRQTGARFIFVDCRPRQRDLAPTLQPLLAEVHRFGCATLYVLRSPQ
ncbi:MAG: hypothetical protein ACJ76Z_04325 [Thermoleophilaceae bacterium]